MSADLAAIRDFVMNVGKVYGDSHWIPKPAVLAANPNTIYEALDQVIENLEYVRDNMPLEAPTPAQLKASPSLQHAWDEFEIIRKLTQ